MSADNGHIIRQNAAGKFVLQEYNASADGYPDVEKAGPNNTFDTLEAAVREYGSDAGYMGKYYDEYGLTIQVEPTDAS